MAGLASRRFVDWKEQHISRVKGNRVIHYYLKDHHGQSTLAVVGTERSLRHIVYVVCDEFLPVDRSTTSAFKWRARREVIDWLSSFISKSSPSVAGASPKRNFDHQDDDVHQDSSTRKEACDVLWVGPSWSCRKRLQHYSSFRRNGITISVHNFVFVMSEEEEHHIAYVEDMYEDKKCRKKLRVRWFHKTSELKCKIPPPTPHHREVFFTQFPQVLSVECVDGLATVLSPDHFDKCSTEKMSQYHVCFRQFDSNDGIKPFSICDVKGYWQQKALAMMGLVYDEPSDSNDTDIDEEEREEEDDDEDDDDDDDDDVEQGNVVRRGPRSARYSRRRRMVNSKRGHHSDTAYEHSTDADVTLNGGISDVDCNKSVREQHQHQQQQQQQQQQFQVGDKIESLCQDSGVRGCWFTGIVTDKCLQQLKIRYDELVDEDGDGNKLEEWVLASKVAQPDKLGVRWKRRCTIRPHPPDGGAAPVAAKAAAAFEFGAPVDAWWNDGWWEGVVIGRECEDEVGVYFPAEGDAATFHKSDLRVSREWINGRWRDVKCDPEALTALGFSAPLTKSNHSNKSSPQRMMMVTTSAAAPLTVHVNSPTAAVAVNSSAEYDDDVLLNEAICKRATAEVYEQRLDDDDDDDDGDVGAYGYGDDGNGYDDDGDDDDDDDEETEDEEEWRNGNGKRGCVMVVDKESEEESMKKSKKRKSNNSSSSSSSAAAVAGAAASLNAMSMGSTSLFAPMANLVMSR